MKAKRDFNRIVSIGDVREADQLAPTARRNEFVFEIEPLTRSRDTPFAVALARVLISSISAAGCMKTLLLSVALKKNSDVVGDQSRAVIDSSASSTNSSASSTTATDEDFVETQMTTLQTIGTPLIDEILKYKMW